MTRRNTVLFAVASLVEVVYILQANAPRMSPRPDCNDRELFIACVLIRPAVPWFTFGLCGVLVVAACAVLLRRRFGVWLGFVGQAFVLAAITPVVVYDVGSFLSTGRIITGIDPSYRELAFNVLALSVVIGPAFTAVLVMAMPPPAIDRRRARTAAIVLGLQLALLAVAAIAVYRATYQDCLHNGPGTPIIDGVPGCPDFADLDGGSVLATIVPSAAVLLLVCFWVWHAGPWAITGALVWQGILAVVLCALGVALWDQPSQNAWYDHFPAWTSPRYAAYAVLVLAVVPVAAALLAARDRAVLEPPRGAAAA